MAIGWLVDLTQANAYFLTERLVSTAWDALVTVSGGKDERTAALKAAYNRIRFCADYTIPTIPSVVQLEKLQVAQMELAYYLALHQSSEDRRKGLHAQGVTGAGVVSESVAEARLDSIPLPPIVKELLSEFNEAKTFCAHDIARDENYHVDDDVTEINGELK